MARMFSKRKGSSGSNRRHGQEIPDWSNSDKKAIEELIMNLYDEGYSTAVIGTILRDQHSVPDVRGVLGMRIGAVIAKNGKSPRYPEDIMNLMRKAVKLIEHLDNNRKDLHNKRALELVESKIRRLATYYRSEGTLPADWKYKRDQVGLTVE